MTSRPRSLRVRTPHAQGAGDCPPRSNKVPEARWAPSWVKVAWSVFSVVSTLLGSIGIPEYIREWGELFALIGSDAARWILSIGGLVILFWLWIPRRSKPLVSGPPTPLPVASRPSPPTSMICPLCKGTAKLWARYPSPCPQCDATGRLPAEFLNYPVCAYCNGTGRDGAFETECEICGGSGRRVPKQSPP
jgi:hypothetical protein